MEERTPDKSKATHHLLSRAPLIQRSKSSLDNDANWLITMSDVMSLLLIFFVMYFMMSKTSVQQASAEPVATVAPMQTALLPSAASRDQENIVDEMISEIRRLDLEDEVSVHAVDKEVVITLKEKVTFKPGEAETLRSSEPILDKIARVVKNHPSFQVDIEGHTDNVPISTRLYPSNWELSVARSTNVLKYFIARHDIDPARLSIKGYADQKPVSLNDTPENRAKNRRVEIRLKSEAS